MNLYEHQQRVGKSPARFKVIRGGRRGGKTLLETEILIAKATHKGGRSIFFIAPTQKQARSIIWESIKNRLGKIGEPNESRLEMKIPSQDGKSSTILIHLVRQFCLSGF